MSATVFSTARITAMSRDARPVDLWPLRIHTNAGQDSFCAKTRRSAFGTNSGAIANGTVLTTRTNTKAVSRGFRKSQVRILIALNSLFIFIYFYFAVPCEYFATKYDFRHPGSKKEWSDGSHALIESSQKITFVFSETTAVSEIVITLVKDAVVAIQLLDSNNKPRGPTMVSQIIARLLRGRVWFGGPCAKTVDEILFHLIILMFTDFYNLVQSE